MSQPPKVIYEYDLGYKLTRCKRRLEFGAEFVRMEPHGTRWRFRGEGIDFYGWDSIKAAKVDALWRCKSELAKLMVVKEKLETELRSDQT